MSHILEAKNISKTYNHKIILDNVNLSVNKGDSIAFVGANGCGKSTLLRILAGITKSTSGKVETVPDLKMAFIPDHFEKANMPISSFMKYSLEMDKHKDFAHTLEEFYSMFQLESFIHTPMKHLSKGNLQKVAVIQALILDVDILLLDEPLSGQDAMSKLTFIEKLLDKKEKGTSLVMACHEKDMIEEITDYIMLIENGHLQNGDHYFYNNSKELILLLLEVENVNILNQLYEKNYFISFKKIGKKYRVVVDKSKSDELLKLCVQNNFHLIKYEEVYKL